MNELIGKTLGRYQILEQLGVGGMAVVYKAFDTRLDAHVAVKVIRVENILPSVLERALKRFEREAKALARLTHPNIVKVTDYGEYEGKPYLVMPYLSGGTLKEKMGRQIAWQEALQTLLPIVEALGYAHSQNMIHRDVKPSNILLTENGQLMLTDFGIAKVMDMEETQDLTGTNAAVGTPEYMAPEQATARTADHRADVYALGIVLYEMVTGQKPYTADTPLGVIFKHASQPLPRPRQFVPGLPGGVEKILQKALEKNPKDRYQNMDEMKRAFEKALGGKTAISFARGKADHGPAASETTASKVRNLMHGFGLKTMETPDTRQEEKSLPEPRAKAKTRPPINFSRKGTAIVIGSFVVILAVWLGSPSTRKLFTPSFVPTTPAITEIHSTSTTIKKIPSSTVPASLTPTTTFVPTTTFTSTPPLQYSEEKVIFNNSFETTSPQKNDFTDNKGFFNESMDWSIEVDEDSNHYLVVSPPSGMVIEYRPLGGYLPHQVVKDNFVIEVKFKNQGYNSLFRVYSRNETQQLGYCTFIYDFNLVGGLSIYDGCKETSLAASSTIIQQNIWYELRIEFFNGQIREYLDGKLVHFVNAGPMTDTVLEFVVSEGKMYYDDIRIATLAE
jgi:serine/threonine protein kinase